MRKLLLLLAAAATADDAAIIEGRKFAILLASNVPDQNPGKVALARDKRGVRGLVAAQHAAGDVLLAVPLDRCLVETRDLPASLKNAPAALTWDVRLALQLHDAILTPDDPFWVEYGTLLPKVEEMGLPLLKRGAELDVLGPELAEPARQQQQRLRELDFPGRSCPRSTRPPTSGRGRCRGRGRSCGRASSARRPRPSTLMMARPARRTASPSCPSWTWRTIILKGPRSSTRATFSSGCARRGTWRRATPDDFVW